MLDKTFFSKLREKLLNYSNFRRELIKISGDAQQQAKKAIFAFQRDDKVNGANLLKEALNNIAEAEKLIKQDDKLKNEGSYSAALEEFVEASVFEQCLESKKIGQIKGLAIDADIYVSGLCDVPGELYRYAIKSATEKKFEKVKFCYEIAEAIIVELVDMNLTGYNRQKFDQAKQALRKLEEVVYDVSMKRL